jgi:hypothetical protein
MHTERQVSDPLPRLTAQRREWLHEASVCHYSELQVLLENYDAVPLLQAALMDAQREVGQLKSMLRDCDELLGLGRRPSEPVEPREPDTRDRDGDYLGSENVRRLR